MQRFWQSSRSTSGALKSTTEVGHRSVSRVKKSQKRSAHPTHPTTRRQWRKNFSSFPGPTMHLLRRNAGFANWALGVGCLSVVGCESLHNFFQRFSSTSEFDYYSYQLDLIHGLTRR